jgi:glycosyltransferase involved in cell wall biosynthesis
VIVGDGPVRAELEAKAASLPGAVTFAGHRDDVMEVLDAADVLLHPSRVDAFPGALLQALAAGVPVVASAVGGIPEIIKDGVDGVLTPPSDGPQALADALEPLLANAPRRRALALAGRARFERHFTARHWATRMRRVYEQALAASAPAS